MATETDRPVPYKHLPDITLNFRTTTVKSLRDTLSEYGVCIIENVLTPNLCDNIASKAVASLEKLGRGADRNNRQKFGTDNTIPQTRAGMYQSCYANNAEVNWAVRSHANVKQCFKAAYATPRDTHATTRLASGSDIDNAPSDLMVSGDGLTCLPNRAFRETGDWAHLDQMHPSLFHKEELANYQGQIGMTNCKHAFRVSVGGHKVHSDIVAYLKKNNAYPQKDADRLSKKKSPAGFLKLPEAHIDTIQDMVESYNPKAHYQCLIPAKKGSLILWDSRCIHSSYRNPEPMETDPSADEYSPFDGWRCIVYVSYRRKAFMSMDDMKLRANALLLNDTTSHWGITKLSTMQRGKLPDDVQRLFSNPTLMYGTIYDPPELTNEIKYLSCISDMLKAEPNTYTKACKLYEEGKYGAVRELLRPPRQKSAATKKKSTTTHKRLTSAMKKMKKA